MAALTGAAAQHAARDLIAPVLVQHAPEQALKWIATLYGIEKAGKDLDVLARQQLRQQETKPVLASFEPWLAAVRLTVAPGSGTAKALDYTIRRWPALIRYADSGSLPIDNNSVKDTIRPIAIGKTTLKHRCHRVRYC